MYFICTVKFYWQKELQRQFIFLSHCNKQLTTHREFGKIYIPSYLRGLPLHTKEVFVSSGPVSTCWLLPTATIILCGTELPHAQAFSMCIHHVPGNFVCAGHGDELLPQQDAVPGLRCVVTPHRNGPFPRLDLCPQVPTVFPHYVLAAVHWAK